VAAARAAHPSWAARPAHERIQALGRFHDLLFARRHELADVITRETGKPIAESLSAEIAIVLDDAVYLQGAVPRFLRAPWFRSGSVAMARKRLRVTHEPWGVVGLITPWNYPFMLACARLLPALATGNAVVFKPSELTPSTGEFTRQLLIDAGVPHDVLAIVQGDGSVGAALSASSLDKIFFTGSVGAGRAVARACAERLVPCGLELGGSDAAIVLADAHIPTAAVGLVWGRFSNAGQTCVAPKRIFVEAPVFDAFLTEVTRAVADLSVGAGTDASTEVAPMIRPQFRAIIEAQHTDALQRGARVVASGANGNPRAFPPTVLTDVPEGARVLTEETFGPLMTVIRVRDETEAVARANAGDFGLSASIWSASTERATAIADRLACGTVAINDVLLTAGVAELPHGGIRHSGYGRVHGVAGIEDCVRTKGVVAERFPKWRQTWWFGYSAGRLAGVDAFLRFAHAPSLIERLRALPGFLRLLMRRRQR
jgi:acyl-CoA reductase-like NAD-dependent aldehyde dehydrogenase